MTNAVDAFLADPDGAVLRMRWGLLVGARICGVALDDWLRWPVVDCLVWGLAGVSGLRALLRGDPERRIRNMIESDEIPVIRGKA